MVEIIIDGKKSRVAPTSLDVLYPCGFDNTHKIITFDSGEKVTVSYADAQKVLSYAGHRIEVTIDNRPVNINASRVNMIIPIDTEHYAIYMDCGDRYLVNAYDANRIANAAEPAPDFTYIDTYMSDTSTYAVQNRVIKKYVDTNCYLKVDKFQGTSYGLSFTNTGRFLGIDVAGNVTTEILPCRNLTEAQYNAMSAAEKAAPILYTVEL